MYEASSTDFLSSALSAVAEAAHGFDVDAGSTGGEGALVAVVDMPAPALDDATGSTNRTTAALWTRWRESHDAQAREALICHYLPYARMVAATLYARRTHDEVEFEDYLQLARIGLVEAVDRFDPHQGARFRTFASRRVQGAVLNGLDRLSERNQQISFARRLRQERLDELKAAANDVPGEGDAWPERSGEALLRYVTDVGIGLALGLLLEDTGMVDADAFAFGGSVPSSEVSYFRKTEVWQTSALLRRLVEQLGEPQKKVIRYHYLQEIPFEQIALEMGCSRARISQLHRQALQQLRELLSNDSRCDVAY